MKRLMLAAAMGILAVVAVGCGNGPGSGKSLFDDSAHPARLHGKWAGDTEYFMKFNTAFEFQPNGRVFWKQTFPEAMYGVKLPPNEGSGTWTVTRVEGDRYTLTMVNDLSPGEKHGWVIVFKGKDEFTITGFDDIPITVKRKS